MLPTLLEHAEKTELLQELLSLSQSQINHFFQKVDVSQFVRMLDLCLSCKGLIVFTGVGKSGIIAEKIAMTLSSTGTKSIYLPSQNFLHGDIGVVSEGDIVVMLSKSGEAEELLQLLPFLEKKKVSTVALTCKEESRLAKLCSLSLHLPLQKELCSFDLIPTTSTALQLIFGDVLAVGLMRLKGFKLEDYAHNHPSGSIGKKITLLVDDLMIQGDNLPLCHKTTPLSEAILELTRKQCGALLIVSEDNKLEGIFTDGDLRRALQQHGTAVLEKTMASLMTKSTTTVLAGELAWESLKLMQKNPTKWIMVVPVLKEDGTVAGLLRMHDIIHAGLS